jgi:hypothetical protein
MALYISSVAQSAPAVSNTEELIRAIKLQDVLCSFFVYILCFGFTNSVPYCRSGSPVSRKSVSGSEMGSPAHGKGSG